MKELCNIALRMARNKGFNVDGSIWRDVAAYMKQHRDEVYSQGAWFSQQLIDDMITAHIDKFSTGYYEDDQRLVLTGDDFEAVVEKRSVVE